MNKPDIFDYLDLRLYLEDLYKYRKTTESGFSYEAWAAEIGFRSRSYLRDLVIGKKPLHDSLLLPLSRGLDLDQDRLDYLILLMHYSVAPSVDLKLSYGRQLLYKWKVKIQQVQIADLVGFLSDSLVPVLFTYLSFPDASSDLEQMAEYFGVERERIQNSLRCLVWQKIVDGQFDEQGRVYYKTVQPFFAVPSENGNSLLKSFHKEGLKLAEQAMDRPSAERKCYATFLAMDEKQFLEFQKVVQDFNQRILGAFHSQQLGEKRIYRFNAQVFPVST